MSGVQRPWSGSQLTWPNSSRLPARARYMQAVRLMTPFPCEPSLQTADRRHEKIVYWHRDLPPLAAEAMDEHSLEATSGRVPGTIAHRG